MAETLAITGVTQHTHPLLVNQEIAIANAGTVWPPYSAFHLAERTFTLAEKVAHRNAHTPVMLDVGTGSGILPIMAKQFVPDAVFIATDLNAEATRLAEHNWKLNKLDPSHLTTMVADGMSPELVQLAAAQGGVDVLLANLPQQPLVSNKDLPALREKNAAAWNVDPSRDPDGLGIFMSVLSQAHMVMKEGGVALVSASSKQNRPRIDRFLNDMVQRGDAKSWDVVSATRFDVPASYDPEIVEHWRRMEESDSVQRLFAGPSAQPQYEHYNIAIHF